MQHLGLTKDTKDTSDEHPLHLIVQSNEGDEVANFVRYGKLVVNYTKRMLSFESDILNAFAGVSKVLEATLNTRMQFGLPELYFHHALFWIPTSNVIRRKLNIFNDKGVIIQFPSWSWAGWQGQVCYMHTLYSLAKPGFYEFQSCIAWSENQFNTGKNGQLTRNEQFPSEVGRTPEARLSADERNKTESGPYGFTTDHSILRFSAWTAPGNLFWYSIRDENERLPHGRDQNLYSLLHLPLLQSTLHIREMLNDMSYSDTDPESDDGSIYSVGMVWTTHQCSPINEMVNNGDYEWLCPGKERGFMTKEHAWILRPDDYPDDFLSDTEEDELPWMAQVMLVEWTNGFAERKAVGYIPFDKWDSVKKEKKFIQLR
jgi:hypothetical protein